MALIANADVAEQVASFLLELGAVRLSPAAPFTWASGWQSPIYCDNRKTLSHPAVREFIKQSMADVLQEQFPQASAVAGVATAGIPMGVLLADVTQLPFAYVRSAAKGHGLGNKIEGQLEPGARVVVVEDLVSTGGSSLSAVEALRSAGHEVVGMLSVFTYGFPEAHLAFQQARVPLCSLSDYATLVKVAQDKKLIDDNALLSLAEWRQNPAHWTPAV